MRLTSCAPLALCLLLACTTSANIFAPKERTPDKQQVEPLPGMSDMSDMMSAMSQSVMSSMDDSMDNSMGMSNPCRRKQDDTDTDNDEPTPTVIYPATYELPYDVGSFTDAVQVTFRQTIADSSGVSLAEVEILSFGKKAIAVDTATTFTGADTASALAAAQASTSILESSINDGTFVTALNDANTAAGHSVPAVDPNDLTFAGGDLVVPGCTDSTASNYNADATEDDGTCETDCGADSMTGMSAMGDSMMAMSVVSAPPAAPGATISDSTSAIGGSIMASDMGASMMAQSAPATGEVFSITMTVDTALTDTEIDNLRSNIASELGVDVSQVEVVRTVSKTVSYSITVSNLSEEQVASASESLDEIEELQNLLDQDDNAVVAVVNHNSVAESDDATDAFESSGGETDEASMVGGVVGGVVAVAAVAGAAVLVMKRNHKVEYAIAESIPDRSSSRVSGMTAIANAASMEPSKSHETVF